MSEKKPALLYLIGIVILFVIVGGVTTLWHSRTASAKAEAVEREKEVQSGPVVRLARAERSPEGRRLELQGEARPYASVTLYAKISGYLKRILVDKGDRVRADQLIAEVESPELDRQYEAAVADATYKQADAKRTAALAGPGVVSARDAELSASQANVAQAQVRAMNTQKQYQVLRAPFAGTVTARFVDPGALVQSAANAQTSAQALVTISQTERLRVYVYVDQRDAADVKVGDKAEVRAPGRPLTEAARLGQVTRLSRELDAKTRTMLVEVDLDNRDNGIVAGSFVQVVLSLNAPQRVDLPVETLVLRGKSAFVPVVKDGVVNYRPVSIAENDGARVRLASGVEVGEEVALNLGDSVADGTRVRPAPAAKPPGRGMRQFAASLAVLCLTQMVARADGPERVSFDEAVRRALAQNPNVTVAKEEISRAKALLEQTRSASLPTLSANGSYTRLDSDRTLAGAVILPKDQVNGNLFLSVPLVQTRGWVQWSHARDNVNVARWSADETRRQIAIAVGRIYLGILVQKRVIEVTLRAKSAALAHYDYANQRFVAGYGSRLDRVRAQQEVATDAAQVERAQLDLVRLQEALGVLEGVDAPVDAAEEELALAAPPSSTGEAMNDARTLRADVKLAVGRLDAVRHLGRDDWADYVPALFGSFSPFLQHPATSTLPERGWQAQLLLSWQIYDGGLRYGLAKERKALAREAEAQLQGTQRQALSEVRAAEEEVRRSVAALALAREAAKDALEAQDLSALGYRAGATTNIEVIDAERAARDAATAAAVAEDALRQGQLNLLIASGRFGK